MLYVLGLLGLAVLYLVYAAVRDVQRRRTSRLPPGPPGLPIFGNALQLPAKFLWYKLHSWSQQYGPFYTIWVMGRPMVILDNVEVAADVLDRMSGITAARPRSIKGEFYGLRSMFISEDLGPHFRGARRALHANFNIRATSQFCQLQTAEVANFALGLLRYPSKTFEAHTHRLAGSSIFRILYGGEPFEHMGEDPSRVMEKLDKEMLYAMLPQNSRVDAFPFLKPLVQRSKWLRREADNWQEETTREGYRLYDGVDDGAMPTIVKDFRANSEKYGLTKHQAVWTTVAIYMAGQETTHTAFRILVLGLLHHPDVRRAAQKQLDAVCGSNPPTFDQRDQLPYIDALVKEGMRWRPGLPIGVPHQASEDFEYRGYVIPKGTMLFDNIWGQTRDPVAYPNPEVFDPTRFLDASGKPKPVTADTRLDMLGFGHGRRVCPGKDFATNALFIVAATLLWAFDLDWRVDEHGNKVVCGVDDFEDHSGFIGAPKAFEAVFTPRQEGLEEKLLEVMRTGERY